MTNPMHPVRVEAMLYELCVRLGFCLPPEEHERIKAQPPLDAEGFTDAVFIAEKMDSQRNLHLRRQVRDVVARHFEDAERTVESWPFKGEELLSRSQKRRSTT